MHALELPEAAGMGDALLGPQPLDRGDAFLEARAALRHVEAERGVFLGNERAAEAHIEAAVGNIVEHRELARELDRMIERRDHRPGDRPHALGARGDRREQHDRIGGMAAVIVEIMLDRLDRGKAERVGVLAHAQALRVELRRALLLRPERGKEIDAEFHWVCSHRVSRAQRSTKRSEVVRCRPGTPVSF